MASRPCLGLQAFGSVQRSHSAVKPFRLLTSRGFARQLGSELTRSAGIARPSVYRGRSAWRADSAYVRGAPRPAPYSASVWQGLKGGLASIRQKSTQQRKKDNTKDEKSTASAPEPLTKRLRTALTPHENIYTLPNLLTFSRLAAAPVIGYLVMHGAHAWAFGLFAYAGLTDLVDGWIARHWRLQTVVGTVIDPMADKTLMTVLTVCLAAKGTLPVYLAILILGRDGLLGLAALYYRYISLPPPKTAARFWDFSLPSAEVRPTAISKANTALQLGLIGATLGLPLVDLARVAWAPAALTGLQYIVATTTVWSGASYVYSKDAVKILNQKEKP